MPTTRRQKGGLNQTQLAASSELPKPIHKSFDDDEDNVISAQGQVTDQDTTLQTPQDIGKADDKNTREGDDDDDDDETVEELSSKAIRKKAAQQANKKKQEQKLVQENRKQAEKQRIEKRQKEQQGKLAPNVLHAANQNEQGPEEEQDEQTFDVKQDDLDADSDEDQTSDEQDGSSIRLDPSLFAQVFSKPSTAPKSILKKCAAGQDDEAERKKRQKLKQKRSGGVVKGRDGLPMKRLDDGTIVRSLSSHLTSTANKKTNFDQDQEEHDSSPLDPVIMPETLDPTVSLPTVKARAFKKQRLGLKGSGSSQPKPILTKTSSKPVLSKEDDPLGLNDPAFLPGGEFYNIGKKQQLTGKKARKSKQEKVTAAGVPGQIARQGFRGQGGRRDASSVLNAKLRGSSLGFARSLA